MRNYLLALIPLTFFSADASDIAQAQQAVAHAQPMVDAV